MNSFSKSICAALALTFAAGSAVPLNAAPMFVPAAKQAQADVIQVQSPNGQLRRDRRFDRRQERREDRFENRQDRREARFERRGNYGYYNGRRGFRDPRPGYRQYNGFWFPPAAFVLGAIVGGAINNNSGGGSAHVQWCYDRYRSYRASDNTYLATAGVRRSCNSPYS